MTKFGNPAIKIGAVALFALVWFVSLFLAHSAVGIYFAGKTVNTWIFLVTTFFAFALVSTLLSVAARLLALPFVHTVAIVLGLLLLERIFARHYQISDWGVQTLMNLSADVAGFIVGVLLGGAIVRNRGQSAGVRPTRDATE